MKPSERRRFFGGRTKPITKVPKKRIGKRRVPSSVKIISGVAGALFGFNTARGAEQPSLPPNPAIFSKTKKITTNVVPHRDIKGSGGFTIFRYRYNLTKSGPIVFAERFQPSKGKPNHIRLGLAQQIKLPGEAVAKLGLRTPELRKGKVDWKKTDFGLIVAKKSTSAQIHRLAGKETSRYEVNVPVGKSTLGYSYMEPGFFTEKQAQRISLEKFEDTLGIDLKGVSSEFGITLPKGKNPLLDVGLFFPTRFGGIKLGGFKTEEGKKRVKAVIIVNL